MTILLYVESLTGMKSYILGITEIIILFHKLLSFQEFEFLIHICGSQAKEDMPAKEKIMNSLERNLCVQTQEAKEAGAEDVAIIKVPFEDALLGISKTYYILLLSK
jgi:hypothetical protein